MLDDDRRADLARVLDRITRQSTEPLAAGPGLAGSYAPRTIAATAADPGDVADLLRNVRGARAASPPHSAS